MTHEAVRLAKGREDLPFHTRPEELDLAHVTLSAHVGHGVYAGWRGSVAAVTRVAGRCRPVTALEQGLGVNALRPFGGIA
jgi:hypothetical protein